MILLLKAALFGASSLGYWEFFRKKTGTNVYFLPLLTVAIQSCVLILGGLLGLLGQTAVALWLVGLGLLGWMLWEEKLASWRHYCSWGYMFFFLGLVLAAYYLRNKVLTHNDNFTHWAIVVKRLLTSDRFPILSDTEIGFPYYPLGSSVYIYWFCKMVGRYESLQMLAQSYIMLTAVLPLFAFSKKYSLAAGIGLAAWVGMLCGYSIRINELLVDTMLPLVGMAAVLYVLYVFSRDPGAEKPGKYALWMLLPLLAWLGQIKNSGMLYAYFTVALLFLYPRWDAKQLWQKLVVAAGPALMTMVWSRHCAAIFPKEAQDRHAMTAGNYLETLAEKTWADMQWIAENTARFMIRREGLFWILAWLAVLGGLTFLFRTALKKKYFRLLGGLVGLHGIYLAGMIAMYWFSMPMDEAMGLASIERYFRTLDISVYCLILGYSVLLISQVDKRWIAGLISVCLAAMSLATVKLIPDSRPWMTLDHRLSVEYNIHTYGIQPDRTYFVCIPGYDDHHYFKLMHNFLLNNMPTEMEITDASQLEEARGYDYLINMDVDNPIIREWIAQNYPDQAGETVIYQP